MEIDGVLEYDPKLISKHIVDFYRGLMGTSEPRTLCLSADFWSSLDMLSNYQVVLMDSPFIE
jgi:hypothetical protein